MANNFYWKHKWIADTKITRKLYKSRIIKELAGKLYVRHRKIFIKIRFDEWYREYGQ